MAASLELTRSQILAFRRRAGALDRRLPAGPASLRQAAWAGLQDSMPRAALLSIHARVEGATSSSWEDPAFVQLWGPRYQAYVVAEQDVPVFSLARLPDDARGRKRAEDAAARLDARVAGRGLGVNANSLRYGATTGTILIRWDGARQPTVWTVPRAALEPLEARLEMARRYLHVFGPATAAPFAKWGGLAARQATEAFGLLGDELVAVGTPIGSAFILAQDEAGFRTDPGPDAPARLLPSGDTYFLLWGADRALLVPDAKRRPELWTPRVWPGAQLVDGEIRGVWRRANDLLTVQTWEPLDRRQRDAVEAEAHGLPLPGIERGIRVVWDA
jgi:hypothetical protein